MVFKMLMHDQREFLGKATSNVANGISGFCPPAALPRRLDSLKILISLAHHTLSQQKDRPDALSFVANLTMQESDFLRKFFADFSVTILPFDWHALCQQFYASRGPNLIVCLGVSQLAPDAKEQTIMRSLATINPEQERAMRDHTRTSFVGFKSIKNRDEFSRWWSRKLGVHSRFSTQVWQL